MNIFETIGLLHIIFYSCLGLYFVVHAAIKGFKVRFNAEDNSTRFESN